MKNMCIELARSISIPSPGASLLRPMRPRARPNALSGISHRSQTTLPSAVSTRQNEGAVILSDPGGDAGSTLSPNGDCANPGGVAETV
jgi:hypothetical protein